MYRVTAAAALMLAVAVSCAAADNRATAGRVTGDPATCEHGRGDERVAACSRALALNPDAKDASRYHYYRAITYHDQRRFDQAIADYDEALRLDPDNVSAYAFRGIFYSQASHDYDRAIADLDQAIRRDPGQGYLYHFRGAAYQRGGDYDQALADFDQAIRLLPVGDNYAYRAGVWYDKGNYDRALSDIAQAMRLDPRRAEAYRVRARVYEAQGYHDRAMSDADIAVRLDPKNAATYADRGALLASQGNDDRAIVDLDEAIRLDPGNAAALSHRGLAWGHKGDFDRAAADLDTALALDSRYARGYIDRAAVAVLRGDRNRARADYETALKLDPGLAAAADVRRIESALAAPEAVATAAPPIAGPPTADATPVTAPAGRRIALVIGMSAYANVAPLRNPNGDARAIAAAFRRLGFADVTEREDLSRARLEQTLKEFGDRASDADWAVIYYAGHGVEIAGENYLVPVDAALARADHVEDEAVALKRVLSKTQAAHRLRLVILDACRNNPFRIAAVAGGPRAVGRGLSPVEPAGGVLVAYAARDGTTADDGGGEHSPFTQALLANLETPGLEINLLFRRVRDQVLARTANAQEPFTYGSLPGEEFYFRDAAR